jgi:hypothetical protein
MLQQPVAKSGLARSNSGTLLRAGLAAYRASSPALSCARIAGGLLYWLHLAHII